jgi:murein DD-endopeptidase MepM/ murein hydrolase activator NlpD
MCAAVGPVRGTFNSRLNLREKAQTCQYWAIRRSVATVSAVNSVINVTRREEDTIRGAMVSTRNGRGASAISGLRYGRHRLVAIAAILGMVTAGAIVGANAAWAADYPSWSDVAAARNNEAATKAAVAQIESLLAGLQAEAARTQAEAQAKGEIWAVADQKFQEAAFKAQNLQDQADAANAIATASEQRAGQMAAQLMRSGGGDITATLFANTGNADNLLYGLGMSSKISEQANAIYERALVDKNTAQSLTDAADVAKGELEALKLVAEKAFKEAQAAATAAAAALQAQQDHAAELNAQLVVLKENRAATEADYLAGVKARIGVDVSIDAGEISDSGWALPVSGYITDGFGYRISPTAGASTYHQGTDIGAGCGANIHAASSGTVQYAGWNGSYGNFVLIDHGNGVATAYGHIVNGGISVSVGQDVVVGMTIAHVGSTGVSTGCHLHFEVRINGQAINSVPFMANQGITIGR